MALTAASASAACTSTSAIHESASGAASNVASPRTEMLHPAGAMNELPVVVVRGVSAVSVSGRAAAGGDDCEVPVAGSAAGGVAAAAGVAATGVAAGGWL